MVIASTCSARLFPCCPAGVWHVSTTPLEKEDKLGSSQKNKPSLQLSSTTSTQHRAGSCTISVAHANRQHIWISIFPHRHQKCSKMSGPPANFNALAPGQGAHPTAAFVLQSDQLHTVSPFPFPPFPSPPCGYLLLREQSGDLPSISMYGDSDRLSCRASQSRFTSLQASCPWLQTIVNAVTQETARC